MERSRQLLSDSGYYSFVVPVSFPSTDRMQALRKIILDGKIVHHVSFSTRPSKLFDGAEQRLTIFVQGPATSESLYSGGFLKWSAKEREHLFALIGYVEATSNKQRNSIWPKVNGKIELAVLHKIFSHIPLSQTGMLGNDDVLYYKNTGLRYYSTVTLRPPRCWINGVSTSSSRETTLSVKAKYRHAVHCLLLSTTFFLYYQCMTNGRDLNPSDIAQFPVPVKLDIERLNELSLKIEDDYTGKGKIIRMQNKLTGIVELESLTPATSKPIIDEIDRVLAAHYGFTDAELDFIINYDIKYRMGREAAEAEE